MIKFNITFILTIFVVVKDKLKRGTMLKNQRSATIICLNKKGIIETNYPTTYIANMHKINSKSKPCNKHDKPKNHKR